MDTEIKKIEKLLKEDKLEEAEQVLGAILAKDLSPAEKGKIYADIALIYMQTVNIVAEHQKEFLKKSLAKLQGK